VGRRKQADHRGHYQSNVLDSKHHNGALQGQMGGGDLFQGHKTAIAHKVFHRDSENAVMIQIWTALITILILKALKAQARYPWYLSNLVAFIRLNLFVKVDLHKWLDNPFAKEQPPPDEYVQGVLF